MAEEPHSFWKTLPGILTAAGGFIGSIAALITALYSAGIFNAQPPAPTGGVLESASVAANIHNTNVSAATKETKKEAPPPDPYSRFNGRYRGISAEGFNQSNVELVLTRQENAVVGNYFLGNQRGTIVGSVTGNRLYYDWQLGNLFGKGISVENAGNAEGTWGYGLSTNNAGTTYVSLVR